MITSGRESTPIVRIWWNTWPRQVRPSPSARRMSRKKSTRPPIPSSTSSVMRPIARKKRNPERWTTGKDEVGREGTLGTDPVEESGADHEKERAREPGGQFGLDDASGADRLGELQEH